MRFTPIESRMLEVLKDGKRHPRAELLACLEDELAPMTNIAPHIFRIRQKLAPIGQGVVCELYHRALFYRWVRFIGSIEE